MSDTLLAHIQKEREHKLVFYLCISISDEDLKKSGEDKLEFLLDL